MYSEGVRRNKTIRRSKINKINKMKKLTAVCIAISILNVVLQLIAHNWSAAGAWLVAAVWQVGAYMGEK